MSSLYPVLFVITGLVLIVPAREGDVLGAENAPLTDCYGDSLPPGAVMRLGTSRFRDKDRCYAIAYSPDGKLLASGGYGGVVLWDAQSGKRRGFLESRLIPGTCNAFGKQLSRSVDCLAFSNDGRYLAAGCTGEAIVWELATDKRFYLSGDEKRSAPDLVGFAPDNRGVFTGDGSQIQLRDWRTGKNLKRWAVPVRYSSKEEPVFGAKTLSADGKTIAAYVRDEYSRKYSLRVWVVGSGEDRRIEDVYGLLALSPDHRILAVFDPRERKLTSVDVATGKVIRSWPVGRWDRNSPLNRERAIAFSPDGKCLVAANAVWSVVAGKELCKLEGYCGPSNGLCFSPDSKTLAAGKGEWIDFWKLPTGKRAHDFPNHRGHVVDLAYSPDGRQLATHGSDSTVRLWDARTGGLIRSFGKAKAYTGSLFFSADGRRLATEHGTSVVIWNVSDGRELQEIRGESGIRPIAISPDGTILLAVQGTDIRERDMALGKEGRHFGAGTDIFATALAPDGKMVAAASSDRILRLWDRETGNLLHEIKPQPGDWASVRLALSFAPGGDLLAAASGEGDSIDLVDTTCGRYRGEIIPYPGHGGKRGIDRIHSLAFSADGKTIVCSAYTSATSKLIEVFSGKERFRFNATGKVVLSPDGRTAASASHGGALIWDITGFGRIGEGLQDCLSNKELERLWEELASTDAAMAHRAIWTLIVGQKKAVSFLRRKVRTAPDIPDARLKELINRLDSDAFEERERASRELAERGTAGKRALLAAVKQSRSLEQRRRAADLLAALPGHFLPASELRLIRAIEVFEHANSPEAREALEAVANGPAGMTETEQARTALQRLRRQKR